MYFAPELFFGLINAYVKNEILVMFVRPTGARRLFLHAKGAFCERGDRTKRYRSQE